MALRIALMLKQTIDTPTMRKHCLQTCGELCHSVGASGAGGINLPGIQIGQELAKPKLYNPRHPERSLLYQIIAEHFSGCEGCFGMRNPCHTWAHAVEFPIRLSVIRPYVSDD
jgi:hypothetical protein